MRFENIYGSNIESRLSNRELERRYLAFQRAEHFPVERIPGFQRCQLVVTGSMKPGHDENQDCFIAHAETGLFGACDGIGGGKHGDEASRWVATNLPDLFQIEFDTLDGRSDQEIFTILTALLNGRADYKAMKTQAGSLKRKALYEASSDIVTRLQAIDIQIQKKSIALLRALQQAHSRIRQEMNGSGTTASIGLTHISANGTRWQVSANLGDSGGYLRRANDRITSLTESDSLISRLLQMDYTPEQRGVLIDRLNRMATTPTLKYPFPELLTDEISYIEISTRISAALGLNDGLVYPSLSLVPVEAYDEVSYGSDGVWSQFQGHQYSPLDTEEPLRAAVLAQALQASSTGDLAKDAEKLLDQVRHLSTSQGKLYFPDDTVLVTARMLA